MKNGQEEGNETRNRKTGNGVDPNRCNHCQIKTQERTYPNLLERVFDFKYFDH